MNTFAMSRRGSMQASSASPVLHKEPLEFEYVLADATELQVMHLTLHVWRQRNMSAEGKMVRYEAEDINPDMSFLEMLDVVNWQLIENGPRANCFRP